MSEKWVTVQPVSLRLSFKNDTEYELMPGPADNSADKTASSSQPNGVGAL